MINDNLKSSNLGFRNGGKQKYITRKFLWLVLVLLPGQATDSSTWKHSISGCRYGEVKHAGWENSSWAWTFVSLKEQALFHCFSHLWFWGSGVQYYVHVFGLKTCAKSRIQNSAISSPLGGWQPGPGSHCHNRGVAPSFDANGQKNIMCSSNEAWIMNNE